VADLRTQAERQKAIDDGIDEVRLLTADEFVEKIIRLQWRLTKAEALKFARLIQRDTARATRVFNERLTGKLLTDDEVVGVLRDLIRDLSTAGDA